MNRKKFENAEKKVENRGRKKKQFIKDAQYKYNLASAKKKILSVIYSAKSTEDIVKGVNDLKIDGNMIDKQDVVDFLSLQLQGMPFEAGYYAPGIRIKPATVYAVPVSEEKKQVSEEKKQSFFQGVGRRLGDSPPKPKPPTPITTPSQPLPPLPPVPETEDIPEFTPRGSARSDREEKYSPKSPNLDVRRHIKMPSTNPLDLMKADEDIRRDEYFDPIPPPFSAPQEQLGDEPDDVYEDVDVDGMLGWKSYDELLKEQKPVQKITSTLKGDEMDEKHLEHDIKDQPTGDFKEQKSMNGGNGDLLSENDVNYLDALPDGLLGWKSYDELLKERIINKPKYESFDDLLRESGIPRPERKYQSRIPNDDPHIHNWDGSAGDGPEDTGLRDYTRNELLGEEKGYADVVDISDLSEGFESMLDGVNIDPHIQAIRNQRRAKARGESTKPYRTSTGAMRKRQKEEGRRMKNEKNRYDQVALVRESNLNHLRSITELLPSI
jgi:hypothetical protein